MMLAFRQAATELRSTRQSEWPYSLMAAILLLTLFIEPGQFQLIAKSGKLRWHLVPEQGIG